MDSGAEASVFDGFLAGCVAFAAVLGVADWLLNKTKKEMISYFFLSVKYVLEENSAAQLTNMAFTLMDRLLTGLFGKTILSVRRVKFYVAFCSIFSLIFIDDHIDTWALIYTTSGWLVFSAFYWIAIVLMFWMVRSQIKQYFSIFILKVGAKILVSLVVSFIFGLEIHHLLDGLFPIVALTLHHPNIKVDKPPFIETARIFGGNVGFLFVVMQIVLIAKLVICFSVVFVPVLFSVAISILLVVTKILLGILRIPLSVVFDRMVISDKGVLTQLGLGLAGFAKMLQEIIKYLAKNT